MDYIVVAQESKSSFAGLIKLMRPRQWVKNGFVLAPLMFSGLFLEASAIGSALFAFVLFCIASSAIYIQNDICDIEDDRRHPKKSKTRPLAAGEVTVPQAKKLMAVLLGLLLVSGFISPAVVFVIAGYIVLNVLYTFWLKHQPVLDIFTIAIGFVLRVYAGAVALDVPVSGWMFATTLCLALYLAAIKRRQELAFSGNEGREVLKHYTVSLVDRYAQMSATGALLFYTMFVVAAKPALVISIPLVLYGLFRYWYIVECLEGGESPTDVLIGDWHLRITILLWLIICAWAVV